MKVTTNLYLNHQHNYSNLFDCLKTTNIQTRKKQKKEHYK